MNPKTKKTEETRYKEPQRKTLIVSAIIMLIYVALAFLSRVVRSGTLRLSTPS